MATPTREKQWQRERGRVVQTWARIRHKHIGNKNETKTPSQTIPSHDSLRPYPRRIGDRERAGG
jgi:hypothetical protein